jgi:hypothetical protein
MLRRPLDTSLLILVFLTAGLVTLLAYTSLGSAR